MKIAFKAYMRTSLILQKRRKAHNRVVVSIAEMISTISTFLIIFSLLMTISNWSAYSRILQDWIDPQVMASEDLVLQPQSSQLEESLLAIGSKAHIQNSQMKFKYSLADLGNLYPNEMRLEVPKVFEGSVPIKQVDAENLNFSEIYTSENAIQEALREGVVQYPYTANPKQYGNVFITGHSSYYPWDDGQYKEIFALLHKLEIGDKYFIYFRGKKYIYEVFDIFEVAPDDVSVLEQPTDKRISTLMTCTPVGTTLRRLIVKAKLISPLKHF